MTAQSLYAKLLQKHIDTGHLRFPEFKPYILEVPLEKVLPRDAIEEYLGKDAPILIYQNKEDEEDCRTLSAPHMISIFLSMLELSKRDKLLVLGAKGGILEAILAKIAEFVYVVEEHQEVADLTISALRKLGTRNVKLIIANPLVGLKESGPFSKILITGAVDEIPDEVFDQLETYGLLVAPINKKRSQQVVQYFKTCTEIEATSYGAVSFQQLYASPVESRSNIKKDFVEKAKGFQDYYSELPQIAIEKVFFEDTGSNQMKLDFDAASYKLLLKLKSHSDEDVKFRVILCAPSVDKEKYCIYYSLSPNKVYTHPLIFANPKKEGLHDFQIVITDDQNNHLTTANFKLEIKKSGWKRALDILLHFVPLVGML